MNRIIPPAPRPVKRRLQRLIRKCRDAELKMRYLIVLNLLQQHSAARIAATLAVSRSTVYRVAERYQQFGEAGLVDRREDNGERKLTADYLAILYQLVASSPAEHGWPRPTWTREMLVLTLQKKTGVGIHVSTMSEALRQIGARRDAPNRR